MRLLKIRKIIKKANHRIRTYHFEIYHLLILLIIVILFQIVHSYIISKSIGNLLGSSLEQYRMDTAERLAELTTTSLEILVQQIPNQDPDDHYNRYLNIQSLNIILTHQSLQENVADIRLIFQKDKSIIPIQDGEELYRYLSKSETPVHKNDFSTDPSVEWFVKARHSLFKDELIKSYLEGIRTFHVLVPFYIRGEVVGAVYMKIIPDFTDIISAVTSSYNQTGALFSALILIGLFAMFRISAYIVRERDQVRRELYRQREEQLRQKIERQKEDLFTRRIYHTHHKAEKIMGFVNEDLRNLNAENISTTRKVVSKYAKFISRVIYDMKTYKPPIEVIRNPVFQTDINEVIRFIVKHIFRRVYREGDQVGFNFELDDSVPKVHINEYVIWEIIEPLIRNSIDHNKDRDILITLRTRYYPERKQSIIEICNNGAGISSEFIETAENGVKKIFLENITTKTTSCNTGYGCYLAYENCRLCGWTIDVGNVNSGIVFTITVIH